MNLRLPLAAAFSLLSAVFLFRTALLYAEPLHSTPQLHNTVNAVVGDVSFVKKFGKAPSEATNERLRLQTHLEYVEEILRRADVAHLPTPQRERREMLLTKLREYRLAALFPTNVAYQERRPCFIDAAGNICAVGYLIEQTAGRALAERINAAHQYDFLESMEIPELAEWVRWSGLTVRECAMIQPAYRSPIIMRDVFNISITGANQFVVNNIPDTIYARFWGLPVDGIVSPRGGLSLNIENLPNSDFIRVFSDANKTVWSSITIATGRVWDIQAAFPLKQQYHSDISFTAATYRVFGSWQNFLSNDVYFSYVITFTVSPTTSIRDLTLSPKFTLSPNPVHEALTLALPENELHTVRLRTALGTAVSALSDASGTTTLAMDGLAAGVYFVEVESRKTRQRQMQKVVKY